MSALWLAIWMFALSLSWLVPNHFPPWSTFHSDAWIACVSYVGFSVLIFQLRGPLFWENSAGFVLILALIPWMQWLSGQISFMGQAWMSSLYIAGFALSIQMGVWWESAIPDQLPMAIFGAIGIAAFASVGLQLTTWLSLQGADLTDIWSMGLSGSRPYANIGQPNLLASLLLWAALGIFWAYQKRFLGAMTALAAVCFLLMGMSLTQSRTGQLSLTVVLTAIWYWRSNWRIGKVPLVATVLYIIFWLLPLPLSKLHAFLFFGAEDSYFRSAEAVVIRLNAWELLWHAALVRPWLGYGWTEIATAQVEVATSHPPLGVIFGHSHNLFLDFVLWVGLPIAVTFSSLILYWAWSTLRNCRTSSDHIIFLFVTVIGLHAMLELPLHHAFFLIPTGMLIGVLNSKKLVQGYVQTRAWALIAIWLAVGIAVVVTVRDYMRIEEGFYALRFEKARIGLDKIGIGSPPEVFVLTELRSWIWAERFQVNSTMTNGDIVTLDALARRHPSGKTIYRAAKAYAVNGRHGMAQYWIDRLCIFEEQRQCIRWQQAWSNEALEQPEMGMILWPSIKSN